METIDLIALRKYTRETGQQTHPELLDARPMEHVNKIEIDEEHVTITYDEHTTRYYNVNEKTSREWVYKYNDDPEFVRAVRGVIEAARKRLTDMPDNISCPPGCAECCSGYEPFVSKSDVERMANHLKMTYSEVMDEYIVKRQSADNFHVGWIRKVTEDLADNCVFLKGSGSGKYYCGIYEGRPHDCRDFSPIGCSDVDESLSHTANFKIGPPFQPKRRTPNKRLR